MDGSNLARLFPGQESGGLTSSLAAAIARELLPLADAVVDLHAGGASLEYTPCAWGRLPARADLAARVLDMMQAFGTSYAAVTLQPGASGTLVADALASGRPAFAAELGGGGGVTTASLSAAREGCRNALAHMGMLEAARAPLAALMAVEPAHFLRSPAAGLFEPYFHLGQAVEAGEAAGRAARSGASTGRAGPARLPDIGDRDMPPCAGALRGRRRPGAPRPARATGRVAEALAWPSAHHRCQYPRASRDASAVEGSSRRSTSARPSSRAERPRLSR